MRQQSKHGIPRCIARVIPLSFMVSFTLTSCSLDNLVRVDDPDQPQVIDQDVVKSYAGAIGIYNSALHALSDAIQRASQDVGLFTDELTRIQGVFTGAISLDARYSATGLGLTSPNLSYSRIQQARVRAAQASAALRLYGTEQSNPLIGNAYAMEGYAVTLLAELFCSGVPLTEVHFDGKFQYTRGFSTEELLEHAVALFDSAYLYGKDSLPIATFARVGKGRALLSLGRYTEAAEAVKDVPTTSKMTLRFSTSTSNVGIRFWTSSSALNNYQVTNREGDNGMVWIADSAIQQDPRVPMSRMANDSAFVFPIRQQKYITQSPDFVLADGIQARLIEAEAQLQPANTPSGPWLTTLNAARTASGLPDTTLSVSATADDRIDLLFRERAFSSYLNAQRLGDLRRLVRNYHRLPENVYPSGLYLPTDNVVFTYGNEWVFIPDADEENLNPLYHGCLSRDP